MSFSNELNPELSFWSMMMMQDWHSVLQTMQSIFKTNGRKGGSDLEYRPFQIAFILMTVESILSKNSELETHVIFCGFQLVVEKLRQYLVLVAIDMAYRRLKSVKKGKSGSGVSVFTRYTLRLLTIQQFRRSLSMFSAAEFLRVSYLDSKN